MKIKLTLLIVFLLSGMSVADAQSQRESEATPFHFSSRDTCFGVQGEFEGTYLNHDDSIEVNVTKATIYVSEHCPYQGRSSINQVKFGLATETADNKWKIESRSRPINLALIMSPKEEHSLDVSYFLIPKDRTADLTKRWFVIEIQTDAIDSPSDERGRGYVFVSSRRDIFVPHDDRNTQRLDQHPKCSQQARMR